LLLFYIFYLFIKQILYRIEKMNIFIVYKYTNIHLSN